VAYRSGKLLRHPKSRTKSQPHLSGLKTEH
jgi:hypothetical protein